MPWSVSMLKSTIDKESIKASKQKSDLFLDVCDAFFISLQKTSSKRIKFSHQQQVKVISKTEQPDIQLLRLSELERTISTEDNPSELQQHKLGDVVLSKSIVTPPPVESSITPEIKRSINLIFYLQLFILLTLGCMILFTYISLSSRITSLEKALQTSPDIPIDFHYKLKFMEHIMQHFTEYPIDTNLSPHKEGAKKI